MREQVFELAKLLDYKQMLEKFRGSERNRNFWSHRLAEKFPDIIVEQNGTPILIQFMGNEYDIEINEMERGNQPWEDWEIAFLKNRFNSNLKYHDYAKALGRSDNEISKKVFELKLLTKYQNKELEHVQSKNALLFK